MSSDAHPSQMFHSANQQGQHFHHVQHSATETTHSGNNQNYSPIQSLQHCLFRQPVILKMNPNEHRLGELVTVNCNRTTVTVALIEAI